VAAAVVEFLHGDLLRAPRRVGHELRRELSGTWSARRGTYRVLYEIHEHATGDRDDESRPVGVVLVVDIDHRGDVYRRR
jgi:mRNA interferase RelE/StbE